MKVSLLLGPTVESLHVKYMGNYYFLRVITFLLYILITLSYIIFKIKYSVNIM